MAERIQKAKEIGGTVDNAEYDDAKNEQAFIEGRILTLENLINNAIVITEDSGPSDVVHIGSTVTVLNQKGEKDKYTIIGSVEADPRTRQKSPTCPLSGRPSSESASEMWRKSPCRRERYGWRS